MLPKPEFQQESVRDPVRILLLEDDRTTAEVVRAYLSAAPGSPLVDCVETLAAALARLADGGIDLVIADLSVPDSKGLATLERLVEACDRLIIVLTASADPALHNKALALGAYDFLHKTQLGPGPLGRLVRLASMQAKTFRSLRESEARFRSLTELSSDMYWEQDREYRFTAVSNEAREALKGRRLDEGDFDMSPAEWASHRAVLDARQPFRDLELGRLDEDGERVWISLSGTPVFDESGGFAGYRGVGRDITERKRAERLLALEHTVTRRLADGYGIGDAMRDVMRAICEAEGWDLARYFQLDEAAQVMRFRQSWSLQPDRERFDEASRLLVFRRGESLVGGAWQAGEPVWVANLAKDPRLKHARFAREIGMQAALFVPISFEGRVVGVLSVASVRTRRPDARLLQTMRVIGSQLGQFLMRKEAQEAGRRTQDELRRFRLAMDSSADIISLIDRATMRYVDVNATACRLTGYSREEFLAMGPQDLLPESRETLERRYDEIIADPTLARTFRSHYRRKDGTLLPLESQRRVLRSGDTWIIVAIARDIRERIESESALRNSEARFRSLTELSSDWYWETDAEGRFTLLKGKGLLDQEAAVLGWRREELHGVSWEPAALAAYRSHLAARRPFRDIAYTRVVGERTVHINISGEPVFDAAGAFKGFRGTGKDMSELRRREEQLRRFRTALDHSADMVFLVDMRSTRLIDFNDTACKDLGYVREELLGQPSRMVRLGVTQEEVLADYRRLVALPEREDIVPALYRRKDGSTFPGEARRTVLDTRDGPILVVTAHDLTERKQAEERQAAHLRRQERIARFGQSALAKRDAAGLASEATEEVLLGLGAEFVVYLEPRPGERALVLRAAAGAGVSHAGLVAEPDACLLRALETGEALAGVPVNLPFAAGSAARQALVVPVRDEQKARGLLCAFVSRADVFGAEETNFVHAVASVLSAGLQRIETEARLTFLAQFDALTGLPNRALLADRFSQMIVSARRHGAPLGVLFVDLDQFKLVNDTLGHAGGDELLAETARRLLAAVRPGDTVARISGDEFAVILNDLAQPDDAALVAQKMIEKLAAPIHLRGQEVFVTASIGIAAFPADGEDAETLLAAADAAMYRAKQSGRNTYQFFTAEINQRTRARAQLGSELRRALEREEFALAYQAKYDLNSLAPCGAEALLRWNHPERGAVSPSEFVPVLEETGLIVAVGDWVLRRACADLRAWQAAGLRTLPVAVNLSARQFRQHDLDARIRALVAEAGVDPSLIQLEITESQLMQDPDHAIRVMHSLGELGIGVAIDDFGTGYSSLAYLTRFPVAALKIDRSFVADMLNDMGHATIVRTIVEMAHTLGFTVVAEGVETKGQAKFLQQVGCEQAQGFLFARPVPADEFAGLIGAPGPASRRPPVSGTGD